MLPLAFMREGESAEIVSLADRSCGARRGCCRGDHLADLGFRPGRQVEMVTNQGQGPLVVRMEESRVALGRGIALRILVRRKEP